MPPARISLPILLLATAALYLPAQPPSEPASTSTQTPPDSSQPIPTLHVTSRLVVLDVVVTDNAGKPVPGLKPPDFTLLEDGVPQKLASFTEHAATDLAGPASPLPPNTFTVQHPPPEDQTKIVIVLVANIGYARDDIAAFLKTAP
jgi:hypothetical protein